MSAHRLAFDVMRSVASEISFSSIHDTRSAVSHCIADVDGTRPRIAAIATVLSVYEYTWRRPVSGCNATRPMVEAANSKSQMSRCSRSCLVHRPSTKRNSPSTTVHAQYPAVAESPAASA
jgi:hypothetical protein